MKRSFVTDDELRFIIGPNVERYRKAHGLTQKALSADVGYRTHSSIANIEACRIVPHTSMLVSLARVLRVPVDALVHPKADEADEQAQRLAYLSLQVPQTVRLAMVVLLEALIET